MNNNYTTSPSTGISERFHVKYSHGIGTLTYNPDEIVGKESILNIRRNLIWLWYENYWYITKYEYIKDFMTDIKHTYSKEQFEEFILNAVV